MRNVNMALVLTRNTLQLTKKCVDSLLSQDIPVQVCLIDNGSTDGTSEWIKPAGVSPVIYRNSNTGVSKGWNDGIDGLFSSPLCDHVLVVNSDTVIPPWFYSSLLSYDGPFISGVSVGSMEEIASPAPRKELVPHPDFSAWLMRRECWEKVGKFDENMVLYASDLDYHIRAHRLGVPLMNAGVPFYHERSSTLNNADPKEKRAIQMQADADRLVFYEKWGFPTWSPEYAAQFSPDKFGCDLNK